MAKQKIHYQSYVYNNHTALQYQSFTVSIKNFAALKVMVTGTNTNNGTNLVYFNNNIILQPYSSTLLQTAIYPWSLDLTNNENEIDETQMTLRIPVGVTVTLIFKFFNS